MNTDINEREKIFCVLCKKYGHPASYKAWEKYKELQRRIKAKRLNFSQKQSQTVINTNTNLSYANVARNNDNINVDNTNNDLSNNFLSDLQDSIDSIYLHKFSIS